MVSDPVSQSKSCGQRVDGSEVWDRPEVLPREEPLFSRLHRAIGPILGGVILDLFDVATFGPIGLYIGLFVGGCVGFWLSAIYGFKGMVRFAFVVGAAIYLAFPMTEAIPAATVIGALARFRSRASKEGAGADRGI